MVTTNLSTNMPQQRSIVPCFPQIHSVSYVMDQQRDVHLPSNARHQENKPTMGCNNTVCPFIVNVATINISTQTEITIRRHSNPISSLKSQRLRRHKNNILSLIPSLHPKMTRCILMKRRPRT